MISKLLVYCWGSLSEPVLCNTLEGMEIEYVKYARAMKDYHADAAFAQEFISVLHESRAEAVFSYDYFPLIAMICEINKIPYLAWIYDCPQYTLLSETLKSPFNHIFCFDRLYTERLRTMGAVNCYHFPLGAAKCQAEDAFAQEESGCGGRFVCDVSFVGNFYNDSKNRVRTADFSSYAKGFIEGLMNAQTLVYGYNFVRDSLPGEVATEVVEKCGLRLGKGYLQDDLQMAADALNVEVTARDREKAVKLVGEVAQMVVYTSSVLPEEYRSPGVRVEGYVDYEKEVPLVFRDSKINLNISSRTIESGIPQRIFDILSCGGFCLTNYQPEIAEYFEDGRELVMYSSLEDLVYKVQYYLAHEEERKQIAKEGWEKARSEFELAMRLREMLDIF